MKQSELNWDQRRRTSCGRAKEMRPARRHMSRVGCARRMLAVVCVVNWLLNRRFCVNPANLRHSDRRREMSWREERAVQSIWGWGLKVASAVGCRQKARLQTQKSRMEADCYETGVLCNICNNDMAVSSLTAKSIKPVWAVSFSTVATFSFGQIDVSVVRSSH